MFENNNDLSLLNDMQPRISHIRIQLRNLVQVYQWTGLPAVVCVANDVIIVSVLIISHVLLPPNVSHSHCVCMLPLDIIFLNVFQKILFWCLMILRLIGCITLTVYGKSERFSDVSAGRASVIYMYIIVAPINSVSFD